MAWAAAALALAGALVAGLSGCAGRSPAEAESQEIRLTKDAVAKGNPRFSPDGQLIAYSAHVAIDKGMLAVFVMPSSGGVPRRISPDTIGVYPIRWSSDGKGIHCGGIDGRSLYYIGLDGSVRLVRRARPLSRYLDVSPDGRTELLLTFNRDNHDVGLRRDGGEIDLLAPTPQWEEGAVFGPDPDQITVVAAPSYQAPQNSVSIWSPERREYTPLSLPEGTKAELDWSPDGQRLAYSVVQNGQYDLWTYDAATVKATPLVDDTGDTINPRWSPDGQWLVFCRMSRTSHLFLGDPKDPGRRQLTDGPARDYAPSVSANGKWVAFMRRPAPSAERGGDPIICVMPAAGGPVTELDLGGLTLPSKSGHEALAWSWNGEDLAFSASDGSTRLDIYRIRRDGTGLSRITLEAGDEVEPKWSPDGRFISYTRVGGGRTQVAVVPSQGGVSRIVSSAETPSEGSSWSPDSRTVSYVTYRPDGAFEVWAAPADAPERRTRLLEDKVFPWPMAWSRDGRQLLLARAQGTEWFVTAFSPETRTEIRVGREVPTPNGSSMYFELTPEGEAFRDRLYPGGTILADGKKSGDLYKLKANPLTKRRLATTAGRFPWIAHIDWLEGY